MLVEGAQNIYRSYDISNDIWVWRILVISLVIIIFIMVEKMCFDVDREYKNARNVHDLNRHLHYLGSMLNSHGIDHWLMFDTLLSAVRVNKISNIINDLDIGIRTKDAYKIVQLNDILKHDGYYIRKLYVYGINIKTKDEKFMWKMSFKISYNKRDICNIIVFESFSDKIMRRYDVETKLDYLPSHSTFPEWFIEKLDDIVIDSHLYKIPRDSNILLEDWFGSKWKEY